MNQQNSEFDISGIQLRESKTQPRVSMSREIGEAQIVHTIFGKAKVRIVRKHDKMRRALWWAGVAGVAAIAAVAWQQGWFATEPLQSAGALPAASPEAQSSVVASPTEDALFSAASSPIGSMPNAPVETAIQTLPQKLIAQQANEIRAAEKAAQMPAMEQTKPVAARQKPVATPPTPAAARSEPVAPKAVMSKPGPVLPQPGMVGKPPAAPLADKAMNSPAGVLQPAKPMPVAPATAATATRVTQPAASSPAAVVPPASPSIRENAAPLLPPGDKTLSDPVNTSGK